MSLDRWDSIGVLDLGLGGELEQGTEERLNDHENKQDETGSLQREALVCVYHMRRMTYRMTFGKVGSGANEKDASIRQRRSAGVNVGFEAHIQHECRYDETQAEDTGQRSYRRRRQHSLS
jgi:hypothetical protein